MGRQMPAPLAGFIKDTPEETVDDANNQYDTHFEIPADLEHNHDLNHDKDQTISPPSILPNVHKKEDFTQLEQDTFDNNNIITKQLNSEVN